MRKSVCRVLKAAGFLALLALLLYGAKRVLERKDGRQRVEPLIHAGTDTDVLFLGTSHVLDGIYPLELWDHYGITSYNLASHQANMAVSYWVLQQALDYTSPKAVVLDASRLRMGLKTSQSIAYVQEFFDGFPLSAAKIRAVSDLLDDSRTAEFLSSGKITAEDMESRKKEYLLFNLLRYHSRWKQLTEDDFSPEINTLKGAKYLVGMDEADIRAKIADDVVMTKENAGTEYLRKIIGLCEERGIRLVLTYLPSSARRDQQKEANTAGVIAAEYGVPYINFLGMDTVDLACDMYDGNSHLNASGAKKVTDYLGRYLAENCGIEDHRGDGAYASWDEDLEEYMAYKEGILTTCESLRFYLMLLYGEDYVTEIRVTNVDLTADSLMTTLLANLGVDPSELAPETKSIVIRDGKAEVEYRKKGTTGGKSSVLHVIVTDKDGRTVDDVHFGYRSTGSRSRSADRASDDESGETAAEDAAEEETDD